MNIIKKISITGAVLMSVLSLCACGNQTKLAEELHNISMKEQWETMNEEKTFYTIFTQDEKEYEYLVEPGDEGNAYFKLTDFKTGKVTEHYFVDCHNIEYDRNTDTASFISKFNFSTDYLPISYLPKGLNDTIDFIRYGSEKKLKRKSISTGYQLNYDFSMAFTDYSAEIKTDKDYTIQSGTLKCGDSIYEISSFQYSYDKVEIPEAVLAVYRNLQNN